MGRGPEQNPLPTGAGIRCQEGAPNRHEPPHPPPPRGTSLPCTGAQGAEVLARRT